MRSFTALPEPERALLSTAFRLMVVVRTALWLLPSRVLIRLVSTVVAAHAERRAPVVRRRAMSIASVVWAIETAGRRVPAATCLTQALAGMILLGRHGHPSTLRLGVARGPAGFRAHAWLEANGRALIGGDGVEQLIGLPNLPRNNPPRRRGNSA